MTNPPFGVPWVKSGVVEPDSIVPVVSPPGYFPPELSSVVVSTTLVESGVLFGYPPPELVGKLVEVEVAVIILTSVREGTAVTTRIVADGAKVADLLGVNVKVRVTVRVVLGDADKLGVMVMVGVTVRVCVRVWVKVRVGVNV